jgi:hypothetical protein
MIAGVMDLPVMMGTRLYWFHSHYTESSEKDSQINAQVQRVFEISKLALLYLCDRQGAI